MSRAVWVLTGAILFAGFGRVLAQDSPVGSTEVHVATQQHLQLAYGKLPLSFEANRGQTDGRVKFLTRGSGYTLFLTGDEAVLVLEKHNTNARNEESNPHSGAPAVLRIQYLGANSGTVVAGLQKLPGKVNYFLGRNPEKWHANVSTYAKVKYRDIYPGVDLVYSGNRRQLEYDLVIRPGGDPQVINFALQGARKLRIDKRGNLVVDTRGGYVGFHRPIAYQAAAVTDRRSKDAEADRQLVDVRYVLQGTRRVSFKVGAYDSTRPLVIDPVLAFSTYLGGNNADDGNAITVDASSNVYVTGDTKSINFPVSPGAFQSTCGKCSLTPPETDAFVTKLNSTGSALVFSTYLGGTDSDEGLAITVDASGSTYITGDTFSPDFPTTPGAFQTTLSVGTCGTPPDTFPCPDAFVAKLDPTGSSLVYSTYLGGAQAEFGHGIVVDGAGNAYVTGSTRSLDFPITPGAFQTVFGGGTCGGQPCADAFVTKLNSTGSTPVYSTYVGRSNRDEALGIAVDASGSAYIAGETASSDFPTTPGAFQTTLGGGTCSGTPCPDAFVAKLDPAGAGLVYSTYLGGSDEDEASGIALDAAGNAYVTGATSSSNFPTTPGAFQTVFGGGTCTDGISFFPCPEAFVTKLNPAGSALAYSTYLGGNNDDEGNGIAVDASGSAFVTGSTASANFPTMNPLQATFGGGPADAFLTRLDAAGSVLLYSTYLGGDMKDEGFGVAVDGSGNAYVTGSTNSSNFPTTPAGFQIIFGGGTCGTTPTPCNDAFVVKVSP